MSFARAGGSVCQDLSRPNRGWSCPSSRPTLPFWRSDEANLRKWTGFLRPYPRVGERAFRIAEGPVLRFVENDVKQVLGITLKVRSLEKATAFLREQGLLGEVASDSVELDPVRTHGLRILLLE